MSVQEEFSTNEAASQAAVDAALLQRLPAVRQYISRIGAVRKNFRKYVVEADDDEPSYGGMRRVLATIYLRDGKAECSVEAYAPTAAEASVIEGELLAAANLLPKSIEATLAHVKELRLKLGNAKLFEFRAAQGDHYLFVQQRVVTEAGGKADLPWSFWSDGYWRCMEPDGPLPLFGLDQIHSGKPIMVHEGAKAAKYVQELTCDPEKARAMAAHPWGAELKSFVHLGWPGGAHNAHRVDWEPLRKLEENRRVVLVCDHDQIGIDAAAEISRLLKRSLLAVRFDDDFPLHFDLADPWPQLPQWWRGARYHGPTLDDLLTPATWATQAIPTPRGRPAFKVTKRFAAEWLCVAKPASFVPRRQTSKMFNAETFNNIVRPFSDVDDTARLLVRHHSAQVGGLAYLPGARPGVVQDPLSGGGHVLNTFRPSTIKPIRDDDKPWQDFLAHLVPDAAERQELMRWCATLVAKPAIRMHYGVLLISETQGVGKGTLGEAILAPLVGMWNCSFPTEQSIVDSSFNSWIAHKRLAVIHEIYAGHSSKAYNKLKSIVTDKAVEVKRKYIEDYELTNYLHVLACSNSIRALHLDDEDRRWFVPRVTEQTRSVAAWQDFYAWLAGDGLGIIRHWADKFLEQHVPVQTGERPPPSAAKQDIVEASRSPGFQYAFDLGERVAEMRERVIVSVHDVRRWIAIMRGMQPDNQRLESLNTLAKALRAGGLKDPARRNGTRPRFKISQHEKSHVLANFQISENQEWDELKVDYKAAAVIWPQPM